MPAYRHPLPQLAGGVFLTDVGSCGANHHHVDAIASASATGVRS